MKKEIPLENEYEFLSTQYPFIDFKGERVQFDPLRHQMEQGEAAYYLDKENRTVQQGIIQKVERSSPGNYPIFTINGKSHMYSRVWPDLTTNTDEIRGQALSKLSPIERAVLGHQ